jgi:hypothetical protein
MSQIPAMRAAAAATKRMLFLEYILCNISYSTAITAHEFASECTDRKFGPFTTARLLRDLSPVVEQNDE